MDRTLTRRDVLALAAGAAIAPIVARLPFADPVAAGDDDIDITAATIVRYFDRIPIEDVRATRKPDRTVSRRAGRSMRPTLTRPGRLNATSCLLIGDHGSARTSAT